MQSVSAQHGGVWHTAFMSAEATRKRFLSLVLRRQGRTRPTMLFFNADMLLFALPNRLLYMLLKRKPCGGCNNHSLLP